MREVETIVGLLAVVVVLVMLARRLNIPYPIPLVLGGLALGFVPGLPHVAMPPDLVLLVFLPPLLYSESLTLSWRDFRANLRPIGLLAIGLVAMTTVLVAAAAHAVVPGLPWAAAFVLGAIVAPTDEVAVAAVAERLPIPRRLLIIIEGGKPGQRCRFAGAVPSGGGGGRAPARFPGCPAGCSSVSPVSAASASALPSGRASTGCAAA